MLDPCSLVSHGRVVAGLSDLAGSGPKQGLWHLSWLDNSLDQWSIPSLDVLPVGFLVQLRSVKPAGRIPSRAAPGRQDRGLYRSKNVVTGLTCGFR